jgi:predicted nucleotidyltransferase
VFPVTVINDKAKQRGLEFLVIGGHAFNYYCEPRTTLDVDLLVRKEDRSKWCELLSAEGFKIVNDADNFVQFSPPYGVEWRLDLMLVNAATFAKLRSKSRVASLLGIDACLPDPEHLIALKLHALRHGHADRFSKDFNDVVFLLQNAAIDPRSESFRKLAEQFGTPEIYEQLLKRFS